MKIVDHIHAAKARKNSDAHQRKLDKINTEAKQNQELEDARVKALEEQHQREIERIRENAKHEIEQIKAKAKAELEIKAATAQASEEQLKAIIKQYETEKDRLEELDIDELLRELILHKRYVEDRVFALKETVTSFETQMKQLSKDINDIHQLQSSLSDVVHKLDAIDYSDRFDKIDMELFSIDGTLGGIESTLSAMDSTLNCINGNIMQF